MKPTWNAGQISWPQVNGTTNVVQVAQNAVQSNITVYAWRNELPGETCREACLDFASQFDFRSNCVSLVACTVQEWSPNGSALLQDRQFGFSPESVDMFCGD